MGIESWSTTPASNNAAPPNGISGTDSPSALDNVQRQVMADVRSYVDTAEWFERVKTPTYISATSFSLAGDYTSIYHPGRRVKCYGTTMGTLYGTISTSSYSSPNTTVSLIMDAGASLTSNLSIVYLSTTAKNNTSIPIFVSSPYPNLLIGGHPDLNPWQRGTTFTAPTTGSFAADNLRVGKVGAGELVVSKDSTSYVQSATSGIYSSSMFKIGVNTADTSIGSTDFYVVSFLIEGYDAAQFLHVYPITVSFWAYSSSAYTIAVSLRNGGIDRSIIQNITTTTSPAFYTLTFPAFATDGTWNYTNGLGLSLSLCMAAGSNFQTTTGAVQSGNYLCSSSQSNVMASTGNFFSFSLVRVNPGSSPSTLPWEAPDLVRQRCYRYYQKSYALGVNPGTATTVGEVAAIMPNAGTRIFNLCPSLIEMAGTPTVTAYSPNSGTSGVIYNYAASLDKTVSSFEGTGPKSLGFPVLSSSSSANDSFLLHYTAEYKLA